MEILNLFWVCLAAFLAGGLNSLAGGGSFITLPSLLFAGISPVLANTTSAAALLPGYFGSVLGFRASFSTLEIKKLLPLLIITTVCSIIGAIFLINSSDQFFMQFIPFLVLIATLLFIFNSRIEKDSPTHSSTLFQKTGLSLVSAYGGYFNGGLGIALLSVLSLGKEFSIKQMSAVKSLLSFLITTISVSVFILNGFVVWSYVVYMVFFSVIGGFFGAKLTERLPTLIIRKFVIFIGLSLSASLIFISYF